MNVRLRVQRGWSIPASILLLALAACNSPTNPSVSGLVLTVDPGGIPASGGTVTVSATVTGANNAPLPSVEVQFTTTAGTLSAPKASTDHEGIARVQLTSPGPATLTARANNTETRLDVPLDVLIALELTPAAPRRFEPFRVNITTTSGGQPVSGQLVLDLGDGTVKDLGEVNGETSASHSYGEEGTYTLSATLRRGANETKKTQTLKVEGFGTGADQIDPRLITWLSPATTNISDWPATSTVTNVSINGSTVCLDHTKAGQWPPVSIDDNPPNIEANILIVVNVDGKWYGGGFDWLGTGRTCKTVDPSEYGVDQIRVPPLDGSWHGPRSGEEVGLLISSPSSNRIPVRSVNERTNIVLVRWP
ncbi:MAG TPA: Ig-like domain-containing protein [Vicinamibacterales bacterium]|nr:Ig-like domain-containing protein [Vicinamibacterales bacterium]